MTNNIIIGLLFSFKGLMCLKGTLTLDDRKLLLIR
jgi:hypothetical protein